MNPYDRDSLITIYWMLHPRFKFIKTLKPNSRLLDIGAGPGGLILLKDHIISRKELKFYAVDMRYGELFDRYEDFQLCDLEKDELKWEDEFFDAAFISHVIEHLSNMKNLLNNIDKKLKLNYSLIYIEVPSYSSVSIPPFDMFLQCGLVEETMRTTLNFYDDLSHINLLTKDSLKVQFMQIGFHPIEEGIISNPYIEDELIRYGIENKDRETFTYGIWSKLGFAEYIVFRRGSTAENLRDLINQYGKHKSDRYDKINKTGGS